MNAYPQHVNIITWLFLEVSIAPMKMELELNLNL